MEADFIQVCGPEVFLPAEVVISASEDGSEFRELRRITREVLRDDRVTFVTDGWYAADASVYARSVSDDNDGPEISGLTDGGFIRARYIRVQARSGQFGGWVFTDEIVIR